MARPINVLVVEDDDAMRESCAKLFRLQGYGVVDACCASDALLEIAQRGDIDIVLTDLKMPEMDGLALLKDIKLIAPSVEVVLMTGYGNIKNAVEAMKHGAVDYITKPFDTNELLMTIDKIVQIKGLREEVSRLRSELHEKYRFDSIVGASASMQAVYEKIDAASKTDSTVLISGESGTGKELVAKATHYNGHRASRPFVPVNCAAIPGELIESELFGHMKGAFTGAIRDSMGLFRSADGGTIFLDEIVDMPSATQAKLLRALQEKRVRPTGGTQEVPVDVRVIASTNQDVEEAVRQGRFRHDLYFRVSVVRIELPPLRERLEDIPALVSHFIAKCNTASHRNVESISQEALEALGRYSWPGNVRELESVIESAFTFGKSDVIGTSDLPPHVTEQAAAARPEPSGETEAVPTLLESERELLVRALAATGGNKLRAAELLGVSRPTLYNMIRRHGVQA